MKKLFNKIIFTIKSAWLRSKMENARDNWLHGPQCPRNYNDEPDGVVGDKIYMRRWLKSKKHSNMVHFHKCLNLYENYRIAGLLEQQISYPRHGIPLPISSSFPEEYIDYEVTVLEQDDDHCHKCKQPIEYHQHVNGCPIDDYEIDTSDTDARTIPPFGPGIIDAEVNAANWQGLSEIESDSLEPIMNIMFFKDGTFSVQLPNEYPQTFDFRRDDTGHLGTLNAKIAAAKNPNLRVVTEPRHEEDKLHIFINPLTTPPE